MPQVHQVTTASTAADTAEIIIPGGRFVSITDNGVVLTEDYKGNRKRSSTVPRATWVSDNTPKGERPVTLTTFNYPLNTYDCKYLATVAALKLINSALNKDPYPGFTLRPSGIEEVGGYSVGVLGCSEEFGISPTFGLRGGWGAVLFDYITRHSTPLNSGKYRLGGWVCDDTLVLDIALVTHSLDEAICLAKQYEQEAVWSLYENKNVWLSDSAVSLVTASKHSDSE
jgi:hypothetical protein|tara:strand:+ start:3304 stop:3984 length:681 start_codon:yes stop_codon:yes gene_type:complete